MTPTNNKFVLDWIKDMADMTQPDQIVWIDGSEAQAEALREQACSTGEMIKLNQEALPGCYLHRTAINDVARVEGRTFICTRKKEDAGNINNWMDPVECYDRLSKLYKGSMKGQTMYVRCRISFCKVRHRAHRLDLRRSEYAHHDPCRL